MNETYLENWKSPFTGLETWALITSALMDSDQSPIWPHGLSHVKLLSDNLSEGAIIEVKYAVGKIQKPVAYRVTKYVAPSEIQYETTVGHPLNGRNTIRFISQGDQCEVVWKGTYSSTGTLTSYFALLWFRIFYKEIFFNSLKRKFKMPEPHTVDVFQRLSHSLH